MVSSPDGEHSRLPCTPPTLSPDTGESNGPSSPSGTEQLPMLGRLESVRRSMQTEGGIQNHILVMETINRKVVFLSLEKVVGLVSGTALGSTSKVYKPGGRVSVNTVQARLSIL